jgi:hypothetical protein
VSYHYTAAETASAAARGSSVSAIIPFVVALVPWIGAWALKRFRPPAETREVELARLASERAAARQDLREDNVDLRERLDKMEARLGDLETENRRLRAVEYRQGRRIDVLERALRAAHIPIPLDWANGGERPEDFDGGA